MTDITTFNTCRGCSLQQEAFVAWRFALPVVAVDPSLCYFERSCSQEDEGARRDEEDLPPAKHARTN